MTPAPIVWITGLPAVGKTTLARGIVGHLTAAALPHLWLDSDEMRKVLTPRPTYEADERDVFYGALGYLALRASAGGSFAIVSATGVRRNYRDVVRAQASHFFEIWLTSEMQNLRSRDPKGLYSAADAGRIHNVPGVDTPYEPPLQPELTLATDTLESPQVLACSLAALKGAGLLSA